MEHETANWIAKLLEETPENEDFADWINDGKIICRVTNELVFNGVPIDFFSVSVQDIEVSQNQGRRNGKIIGGTQILGTTKGVFS